MKAKIQKWGNSLAVRIPKPLAKEIKIDEGQGVEIFLDRGKLVVEKSRGFDLESLVSEISDENLHKEIPVGPPKGREVW